MASTEPKAESFEARVPLWKDDAQRIVYGVVLTPEVEDSQGDVVSAQDIEKAAHAWLIEFRKHDVQHSNQPADIVPVESFIAPVDFEVTNAAGEKQTVLKGSWVLASRVNDPDAWAQVEKGELTGWSITGSGFREPIPVA